MPLDLTGELVTNKGFDPGNYPADIHEVKIDSASGQGGSIPAGTPTIKVQVKIQDGKSNNRRAFANLFVVGKDYKPTEPDKGGFLRAKVVEFFEAVGYSKEEIQQKKFDPDLEAMAGKRVIVNLGPAEERPVGSGNFNNPINRFMPESADVPLAAGEGSTGSAASAFV